MSKEILKHPAYCYRPLRRAFEREELIIKPNNNEQLEKAKDKAGTTSRRMAYDRAWKYAIKKNDKKIIMKLMFDSLAIY